MNNTSNNNRANTNINNTRISNENIDIILKTLESAADFARLQAKKKRKSSKRTLRAIGTPLTLESRVKRGLRYLEAKVQKTEKSMIGKGGQELSNIIIQRDELKKYMNLLSEKLKQL